MRRTQAFQLPIDTLGRLRDPAQFADIVVKTRGSRPVSAAGGMEPSQGGGLPSSGITDPLRATVSVTGAAGGTTTTASTSSTGTASGPTGTAGTTSPLTTTTSSTSGAGTASRGPTPAGAQTSGGTTGGGTTPGGAQTGGGGTLGLASLLPSTLTVGGANITGPDNGALSSATMGR